MYEIRQEETDCFVFPHLETFALEILSALCSLVLKSTDKNSCTRALWVISKQSFSADVVAKKVSKEQKNLTEEDKETGILICGCYIGSGAIHTGHTGQCMEQRGCPVCCHGTRGSERCHEVKQSMLIM